MGFVDAFIFVLQKMRAFLFCEPVAVQTELSSLKSPFLFRAGLSET